MPAIQRGKLMPIIVALIMAVLMIQNYFLVKKIGRQQDTITALTQSFDRLTQVKEGDTIGVFSALSEDSTLILFDPGMGSRKTLMFVFTTWCNACKGNMGQWNLLVGEADYGQIDVIGLTSDSLFKVKQYWKTVPMSFRVLSVANDFGIMKRHKLFTYPTTLLLDHTGVVRHMWRGALTDR
jgi:peroxiredoxin